MDIFSFSVCYVRGIFVVLIFLMEFCLLSEHNQDILATFVHAAIKLFFMRNISNLHLQLDFLIISLYNVRLIYELTRKKIKLCKINLIFHP